MGTSSRWRVGLDARFWLIEGPHLSAYKSKKSHASPQPGNLDILSCQQSNWFATCTSRVHSLHILPVVCRRHSLQTTLRLIHFHHCVHVHTYTPDYDKNLNV